MNTSRNSNATHVVNGLVVEVLPNVLRRSSRGALVESESTNLFEYSIDFSTWSGSANTTAQIGLAPDNTTTATLLSGGLYKTTSANTISLHIQGGNVSINTDVSTSTFDPVNVEMSGSNCDLVLESIGNGWYRAAITNESISTLSIESTGANIWGAQGEAKNYVSSFIYTRGSTETRAADSISLANTPFEPAIGTVFVDFELTAYNIDRDYVLVDFDTVGAKISTSGDEPLTVDNSFRLAFSYDRDNLTAFISSNTIEHPMTILAPSFYTLGSSNLTLQFDGYIKELAYWPETLDTRYLNHAVL